MNIIWKDLPKPRGLFTKRSTTLVTLDTKKAMQFYSANTKINVAQYTFFNDSFYFRTESAKEKGLNLAIKADSFDMPKDFLASLEPSESPIGKAPLAPTPSLKSPKQKPRKKVVAPSKNEGKKPTPKPKAGIIKRFLHRIKKGTK